MLNSLKTDILNSTKDYTNKIKIFGNNNEEDKGEQVIEEGLKKTKVQIDDNEEEKEEEHEEKEEEEEEEEKEEEEEEKEEEEEEEEEEKEEEEEEEEELDDTADIIDDDDDDDDDDIEFTSISKEESKIPSKNKVTNEDNMTFLDNNYNNDFTTCLDTLLLQKISKDYQNDYIINNHSNYLNNNIEEIRKLSNVIRNKDNIIIDEFHKTIPFLSKYEKTKIMGIRVKQLNNNAKPYINLNEEEIFDNYIIASKELIEKKLPFIIQRPLPNNTFEYWKLSDLDIIL